MQQDSAWPNNATNTGRQVHENKSAKSPKKMKTSLHSVKAHLLLLLFQIPIIIVCLIMESTLFFFIIVALFFFLIVVYFHDMSCIKLLSCYTYMIVWSSFFCGEEPILTPYKSSLHPFTRYRWQILVPSFSWASTNSFTSSCPSIYTNPVDGWLPGAGLR